MDSEKIGKFICELRKSKGLTQKNIADKLNISDNSVSKWERGINIPDISSLTILSKIFNVTVSELLNGEYDYKKKNKNYLELTKVIEINNLMKNYGKKRIINNLNLTIYEGEIVGLVGANGVGKTTLMKCILNFCHINKGEVKIFGKNLKNNYEHIMSSLGAVVENPNFYPFLTGKENIKIVALLNNITDQKYINEMVNLLQLRDALNKKVSKYSLGMKQRLGLVCALIKKPKLLILDEPIIGLDPLGIKEFKNIIQKINNDCHTTILISSHILSEIENMCDRKTILRKEKAIILSDILLHERDNEEIKRAISNPSSDLFESAIYLWQDYSDKELIEMADTAKKEIKDLENLIDNGNYYDYKVYQLRNGYSSIEKIKLYQEMIMKRKINDANNYNYQNIYNYDMFFINSKELVSANKKYPIVTKDEFKNDNNLNTTYANYETYQNAYKLYQKDYTAKMHIIEYAIENDLPSNILNGNIEYPVFTAANNVNTMPKLSFIVMLVIVLTSSGIITNEYNRGIKILFTSNIKRWKIFWGKFIYLILHSYILWFVLFVILYIYSGVIFGFKALSYPALIYTGNKVIEINYIIYNLIKIVILNIPLIAFISLIILLSTIINSNIFITMISTTLSILTSFIWSLICESHLTFLTKSIIPYFNLYEIIKHHNILSSFNTIFQDTLCFCNTNLNKGLIISFITIIINYFIANYLFNKKEI